MAFLTFDVSNTCIDVFDVLGKRVLAPFNDNVLGLMRLMCGTRVTLLSFGTREYFCFKALSCAREFRSIGVLPITPCYDKA